MRGVFTICTASEEESREGRAQYDPGAGQQGEALEDQMKLFINSTADLWLRGEMEGKPAGIFTSTASIHGGQETTLVTMMGMLSLEGGFCH